MNPALGAGYSARFSVLDIDPYASVARSVFARKEQWKRLARQAAVSRSGACDGGANCVCPNCAEYNGIMSEAAAIAHWGTLPLEEAFSRVCRMVTNGAAETPWSYPK
jgi:hypothetical protein